MIIYFNWNEKDGAMCKFSYPDPTAIHNGEGMILLSPRNDVEIIFEAHELLQPLTRELCYNEVRDSYELLWDANPPFYDDIEGQLTFNTIDLSNISY